MSHVEPSSGFHEFVVDRYARSDRNVQLISQLAHHAYADDSALVAVNGDDVGHPSGEFFVGDGMFGHGLH